MRHVMVQIASGEPYESMLDLTKEWHNAYCARHNWEYSPRKAAVPVYAPFCDRSMAEVYMAKTLYEYADDDICAFMPIDAIVTKTSVDLRDSLPHDADFSMFGDGKFVNSGFSVVRNSPKVREFFDNCIRKGPVGTHDDISMRISLEINESSTIKCCYLGSKWQWHDTYGTHPLKPDCPESEAIIRAWHGGSRFNAFKAMKVWMCGLKEGAI